MHRMHKAKVVKECVKTAHNQPYHRSVMHHVMHDLGESAAHSLQSACGNIFMHHDILSMLHPFGCFMGIQVAGFYLQLL